MLRLRRLDALPTKEKVKKIVDFICSEDTGPNIPETKITGNSSPNQKNNLNQSGSLVNARDVVLELLADHQKRTLSEIQKEAGLEISTTKLLLIMDDLVDEELVSKTKKKRKYYYRLNG